MKRESESVPRSPLKNEVNSFLEQLKATAPGIDREFFGYRFKHLHFPAIGLFSTKHNGNWTGTLLEVLFDGKTWDEKTEVDGKTHVMGYERNFNNFVAVLRKILKE